MSITIQNLSYPLQFKDGSGNPLAGIGVVIFPAGADTSNIANAVDGGNTDANGSYTTAPLPVGVMYAFTTSSGVLPSGTFFAGVNNQMVIVLDPTHTSGSYPGSSGGGLTTVPSTIRLSALLYGYSLDPAAPIGTGASIRTTFQVWGKNGPPAGMHFADGSTGLAVGGISPDYVAFSGVPDPNAAITSPTIIGYGVDAIVRFHDIVFNTVPTTPASVDLLVNLVSGGLLNGHTNGAFARANLYFDGDQVTNGNAYADAHVKEIIGPSSGGTFAPFTFHVQAQHDAGSILTSAQSRVWFDITLTPLFE